MNIASHSPGLPQSDRRFQRVLAEIERRQFAQHALIEVLHVAQAEFGYLNQELLLFVARQLKLPPSRVYGVASFYHLFSLKPRGVHQVTICTGTACYLESANALLDAVAGLAQIRSGDTSPDRQLSLSSARCLGTCGSAPVAVVDGEILGSETPGDLTRRVKIWLTNEPD